MQNNKIALLMLATGPYTAYLERLIPSINQYLLPGYDVTVHVFTDKVDHVTEAFPDVVTHYIPHTPHVKWYPTLDRFHIFMSYIMLLSLYDNYIYIDSDSLITDHIGPEILGDRVYVQHCGFLHKPGSWESNKHSACYVPDEWTRLQIQLQNCDNAAEKSKLRKRERLFKHKPYVAGSIWSFSNREFWTFCEAAIKMIDTDLSNRIVPVWADESVINRYAIDNPATTLLDPSYHYPEKTIIRDNCWNEEDKSKYNCKIMQLMKNHTPD